MESRGAQLTVLNCTVAYSAVIDACAKRGDIDGAEGFFGRMIEKGIQPNVVTFSSIIDSCAKAGNLSRAESWYEKMLEHGIAPSVHTYGAIINACARHGGHGCAGAAEKWLDRA